MVSLCNKAWNDRPSNEKTILSLPRVQKRRFVVRTKKMRSVLDDSRLFRSTQPIKASGRLATRLTTATRSEQPIHFRISACI